MSEHPPSLPTLNGGSVAGGPSKRDRDSQVMSALEANGEIQASSPSSASLKKVCLENGSNGSASDHVLPSKSETAETTASRNEANGVEMVIEPSPRVVEPSSKTDDPNSHMQTEAPPEAPPGTCILPTAEEKKETDETIVNGVLEEEEGTPQTELSFDIRKKLNALVSKIFRYVVA